MRLRAAVLTVLAGAALAVPAAPAAAAACTQGSGVTVVVDFASLGGGTQTRCAPGDPPSGLEALRGAGFTPTRAAQQPGYFVCRIDGKPASDPCQRTSPANAYWSYWHAKPGGTWAYSDLGAADYDPPPNTVEGWAFGAGKPPSSPPPRPAHPSPSPVDTATPAATPAATAAPPVVAVRASAPPSLDSTSASPRPSAPPPPVPAASAAAAAPINPSSDPDQVTRSAAERTHGIPWSVLAGLLVFLLLVVSATRQALRRRGEGSD